MIPDYQNLFNKYLGNSNDVIRKSSDMISSTNDDDDSYLRNLALSQIKHTSASHEKCLYYKGAPDQAQGGHS